MIDTVVDKIVHNLLDPTITIIDKESDEYRDKFTQIYNEYFKEDKINYYKNNIESNSSILSCKISNKYINTFIKLDFLDSYNKFFVKEIIDYYESKLKFEKIK